MFIEILCLQPGKAGFEVSKEEIDEDTQQTSYVRRQTAIKTFQQCYFYITHHPLGFLYLRYLPPLSSRFAFETSDLIDLERHITNFEEYALSESNQISQQGTIYQEVISTGDISIQPPDTLTSHVNHDEEDALTNSETQTLLAPAPKNPKKKKIRSKKKKTTAESLLLSAEKAKAKIDYTEQIISGLLSPICLPPYSLEETIPTVETFIQTVIQHKIEQPVQVHLPLNHEDIFSFDEAFKVLVQKYPFPFTWSMTNKGPLLLSNGQSPYLFEVSLASRAREKEEVEQKFVYQVSPEEGRKINWSHVFGAAMSAEFTLEDFKFNNAIKIRLIELKEKTIDKNLEIFQQFLKNKLPKDNHPFHIIGILINKEIEVSGNIFSRILGQVSEINPNSCSRGTVCDPQSNSVYICLNNTHRHILDLHGGRGKKIAREETTNFIIQSYEDFEEGCTVLTGRGNHVNVNGKSGVLRKAFTEWMEDKNLAPLIKSYFPLEGEGAYKVIFPKIQTLDLRRIRQQKHVSQIKGTIAQMAQQKKRRLHIAINPEISSQNPEFNLLTEVHNDLHVHDAELLKSITPISFESISGEIKIIFNKKHPQNPSSFTFMNNYGSRCVLGTIR